MKKQIKINPVGLKGNQINERMRELMGIQTINENKSNIVVELTKLGPDGNAYAIVRENHEWYIKRTNKTENLLAEDFKYIGGLANKKSEAYPSYARAIKHLNLKFKSLAEAYNFEGEINVFENDNLINESGIAGFAQMEGLGFNGEGNLEGNKPMTEEKPEEEVEMSEAEEAVDAMLKEDEEAIEEISSKMGSSEPMDLRSKEQKALSAKYFGEKPKPEPKNGKKQTDVKEGKLSIDEAMKTMDSFIDLLTTGLKKKV